MQLKAQIALEKDNKSILDSHTSLIQQNADSILLRVESSEFTGPKIASMINLTDSTIKIQAQHIALEGHTTINGNFKVLMDGSIEAVNGKFSGNITATSGKIGRLDINANQDIYYQSDLFAKQYDNSDVTRLRQIMAGLITATDYDNYVYDVNNSGLPLTSSDFVIVKRIVEGIDPNPNKMIRSIITIGKTTGEIEVSSVSTDGYIGHSFKMQGDKITGKMANIEALSAKQLTLNGLEVYSDAGTLKVR